MLPALLLALVAVPTQAVTARWDYEAAYDNVAGGDWYRDADNSSATLAWGESYVMMSLASMFRATGDPVYLERLVWHADGVLAQRDEARGVADYRGVSAACWQNTSYQEGGQPYCYAVHSGMIGTPIAQLALLVRDHGLRDELAHDGVTFGEKADGYTAILEDVLEAHADQWDADGFYAFRADATFLGYPGRDLPLNQSNALGRLLLVMHDLTGDTDHLDKATRLAQRFEDQLTVGASGGYLWNYWGGAYSGAGEDVSHASLNVDFAVMAAEAGVVFNDADLARFATTFVEHVYVDDATFSDQVGGGAVNGSSYRPQVGRWLRLTPHRTTVYTAVRDLYDADYPPDSIGSGSLLLSRAYLAELEPPHCAPFFYSVDWADEDASDDASFREATAYGANVLTTPPELTEGCMVPLTVEVPREATAQQWDGAAYHDVARWQATAGEVRRFLPYEPAWPHLYWDGGVLFQLADDFVEGDGVRVREHPGLALPEITSVSPVVGRIGEPVVYDPSGTGDAPFWWSLTEFPTGARVDAETGELRWTPTEAGRFAFSLRLENDAGSAEQGFVVEVASPSDTGEAGDTASADTGARDDPGEQGDTAGSVADGGESGGPSAEAAAGASGCGCAAPASPRRAAWLVPLALLLVRRRVARPTPRCR